jgi:hypothetical protein
MQLPKEPQARKRVGKAVAALMKLPAEKRKPLVQAEMKRRGLTPKG